MPTTTVTRATIERPEVPPVNHMVRPRDSDGVITHDVAVLHLPGGATATIKRHVSADDVIFTGHIRGAAELDWIDDDDRADALAEAADFIARERRAAHEEYAAIQRHPAGKPHDALAKHGQLYRNDEGHEVWRVVDHNGKTVQDNIASDHDAAAIAAGVAAAIQRHPAGSQR